MGWYGNWEMNYNGTNNDKFVKLAKLLIPNYIERFKENDEKNRLECTRNLRWESADVDISKIMEYLDDKDSIDVTIYGETKPYIIGEDGEEKELDCEKQTFRKENGNVVIDNEYPDEQRYTMDELGIYDYLAEIENIDTYIPFITREIGLDDEIIAIAQPILYEVFSKFEDSTYQPLVDKSAEMKAKFINIETAKLFFKEMYEKQKDLIEQQNAEKEKNKKAGIPSFLSNMSQNDIDKMGGIEQLILFVDKLGEENAREALRILGCDVGPSKIKDKKMEPETIIKLILNEKTEQESEKSILTVDDLRREYTYVFDKPGRIIIAKKEVDEYVFFKDEKGIVTLIPELSYQKEGDINGNYYRSSRSDVYVQTRDGSHTFDVHEWGFRGHDEEGKQIDRFDKHYRYVTLDDIQKVVKVFESENYIDKAWSDLYHRNKDENGKLCIRLVDLAGNVHSIKEGGKVAEAGLREKTFGPRGDYQLKVVYKDKEPVYALFLGDYLDNEQREFCTAEELKRFSERKIGNLRRAGVSSFDKEDCFYNIEEIIEKFNDTFMKGNFVPKIEKSKRTNKKKTVTELAEELNGLEEKEGKAKSIYEAYDKINKEDKKRSEVPEEVDF